MRLADFIVGINLKTFEDRRDRGMISEPEDAIESLPAIKLCLAPLLCSYILQNKLRRQAHSSIQSPDWCRYCCRCRRFDPHNLPRRAK